MTKTESPVPSPLLQYIPLTIILGAIVATVYSAVSYTGDLDAHNQAMALLCANLGLLPSLVYFSGSKKTDFPLFELLMLWYSISLGWSSFFPGLDWYGVSQEHIAQAYNVGLLGILAGFAGNYLLPRMPWRIRFVGRAFEGPTSPQFMLQLGVIFAGMYVVIFALGVTHGSLIDIVRMTLGGCGLCLLWLYYYDHQPTANERLMIIGLTILMLVVQAMTASLKMFVITIVLIGIVHWRCRRDLPLTLMAVVVVLFVLLNPVKVLWREKVNFGRNNLSQLSLTENLQAFADSFHEYYFGEVSMLDDTDDNGDKANQNRVCDINILAKVVFWTPDYVPYWDGLSLQSIPYALVPRFLMPSKPKAQYANEFGRVYDFLSQSNRISLISTAWITDLYANYGRAGVILGMMLIGFLLRWLQESFSSTDVPPLQFASGVAVTQQLYNGGENLAVIWGGVPLGIVLVMATVNGVHYMMMRGTRRYAPAPAENRGDAP